ncbi:trichohyalin-like [Diachasma alloeum]|uniref:trichohyalin-like n=1 Tax=Diachasma alloeum TaxID=454923 RepID=UPI0007382566|nr:trichohyalin-like [Diachasma alloeum]
MERIEEKETLGTKSHLKRTPVTRKEGENENLVSEEQEKGALEETTQEPGGRKIGKGCKGREAREGSGEAGEGSGEAGEGSEYESTEERVSEADTNEEVWIQESMKSWLKKWEEKQKEEWEARMSDLEGKELVAETGTRNTEGREPGGEGWRCEDCERRRERRTEESGPRQGNFRQTWWKDWGESNYERVEQVGKEKDRAEFETRKKDNEEQKKTTKRSNEERILEGRQETTQSLEINTSGRKSTDSGTEGWGEGEGPQETQEKMEEPPRWREKTGTRRESSSGSESIKKGGTGALVPKDSESRSENGRARKKAERRMAGQSGRLGSENNGDERKDKTGRNGLGVYIEDDLTERQRVVQAWLEKEARNWRRRGIQAETAYNSLMVDRAGLEWDEEKGELRQKGRTETHLEAKGMKKMQEKLNSKFEWFGKEAKRIHKRGKASGEYLVGIRKTLEADWIVEESEYGMKLRIQEREIRESYRMEGNEAPSWFMDMEVREQEGSDHLLIIFRVEWNEEESKGRKKRDSTKTTEMEGREGGGLQEDLEQKVDRIRRREGTERREEMGETGEGND